MSLEHNFPKGFLFFYKYFFVLCIFFFFSEMSSQAIIWSLAMPLLPLNTFPADPLGSSCFAQAFLNVWEMARAKKQYVWRLKMRVYEREMLFFLFFLCFQGGGGWRCEFTCFFVCFLGWVFFFFVCVCFTHYYYYYCSADFTQLKCKITIMSS